MSTTFTVTAEVESCWTLQKVTTGEVVYETSVKTSHRSPLHESISWAVRSKKSLVGALKENIQMGIQHLSQIADISQLPKLRSVISANEGQIHAKISSYKIGTTTLQEYEADKKDGAWVEVYLKQATPIGSLQLGTTTTIGFGPAIGRAIYELRFFGSGNDAVLREVTPITTRWVPAR